MTNLQKGIALVIAGAVIGFVASVVWSGKPIVKLGEVYHSVIEYFPSGIGIADKTTFNKSGTIGPGVNQTAYTNNTGVALTILAPTVTIAYTTGTASSSYLFYVSTSTATTITDYTRPVGGYKLIDGATIATSTTANASLIVGTSTAAGKGGIVLQPGESLIFAVEPVSVPTCTGLCETATSSSRGIQIFNWNFLATY